MRHNRALVLSCILAFALACAANAHSERRWSEGLAEKRGILDPVDTTTPAVTDTTTSPTLPDTTSTTTTKETTTTTPPPDTTTTTTPDTPITTPPTTTDPITTPNPGPNTSKTDTTTKNDPNPVTTPTPNPDGVTPTPSAQSTHVVTTGADGEVTTVYSTFTPTPSLSGSSSSSSQSGDADSSNAGDDESSGISTGSIIGMSVAGGVALIGAACFVFWKFTRKRIDDFDDNEAIKWPELNAHGGDGTTQLPAGAGRFDGGSEVALTRQTSTGTTDARSYAGGASNYSTTDLGPDPYAVPPLPHMNPNQPYRDDPGAAGAYYDPYRGPVPQFGPTPGEVIPMNQMAYGDIRSASPGMQRMASPAPMSAGGYGLGATDQMRSASPMRGGSPAPPQYGRTSPGPQAAYDPVTYGGMR